MLPINGAPNIERNIVIMRDELGIEDICVVTGYYGDAIRDYFGDGRRLGVKVTYAHNDAIDKGLAYSVLLGREHIDDYFCVILSDECYVGSNHRALLDFPYREALVTCGVMQVDDVELIKRNYSVEREGDRITGLIEKPKNVLTRLMGSGTFVFDPRIFACLDRAFSHAGGGAVDLVTLLGDLCRDGEPVKCFDLTGQYININDRDSLHHARYYVRDRCFDTVEKSLVIYSEGDEHDIGYTIREYAREDAISQIAVVVPHDNGIEDAIVRSGAEVIRCPPALTLYGEKLKYAIERVRGGIIILTEADYSFQHRDIGKLLAYLREADMVIGTRTTRQLIDQASNMRGLVRLANVWLAKLIELLWMSFDCRFTDVGCTFRGIWRGSFNTVKDHLVCPGPEFSAEMMVELLRARERIIEVPVSYYCRSFSMFRKYQNVTTFLRMLRLIVGRRLGQEMRMSRMKVK